MSTENDELYGSVKPSEISKTILKDINVEIKPQNIQLKQEIKSLGNFEAKIELHSEIEATIKLKIFPNNFLLYSSPLTLEKRYSDSSLDLGKLPTCVAKILDAMIIMN